MKMLQVHKEKMYCTVKKNKNAMNLEESRHSEFICHLYAFAQDVEVFSIVAE